MKRTLILSDVEWIGRASMRDVLKKLRFAVFEFRLAPGRTVEFPGFKGKLWDRQIPTTTF
ncbi:MAG: hypothetical protein QG657_2525 [Acidobacteriota bacterium]|nr:hypothetical protein [Acidobacteriota bacterium]